MPRTRRRPSDPCRRMTLTDHRYTSATDIGLPFDFSMAMAGLCREISGHVPALAHVQMERVAVCITRARHGGRTGLWAKLTPLRFENGERVGKKQGRWWRIDPLVDGDCEFLYILTFCLPRFLDLTFREKLETVFHELFHVGPHFDGDYRRFPGRYHVHSPSQKHFDARLRVLVDDYLDSRPAPQACRFLRHRFRTLIMHHGAVIGNTIPVPKLIPVEPDSLGASGDN